MSPSPFLPSSPPALLVLIPLQPAALRALGERFELIYEPQALRADPAGLWLRLGARAGGLRAVLTNGTTGLDAAAMDALPALGLIACFGAGYENVDLDAARARGVRVSHAPGANNATVADHALALMLSLARGLLPLDAAVKRGDWEASRAARPTLSGARLGLLGMGHIGQAIAARAAAFGMSRIAYCTRTPRADLPAGYEHVGSVRELARGVDFLVLACPGGPATRHLVDRAVLRALGPAGYLVNVARGSVVDQAALIAALEAGEIAGAGLDVLEDEPAVPAALCQGAAAERVLLTPHVSGRSPQAQRAQVENVLENVSGFLAGRALLTALV
jgi:lactate dehydrogenase-like 2-hydroxyacid dehydrogenase